MINIKKIGALFLFIYFSLQTFSIADNHNIREIIDLIQRDLKTLERAVYSDTYNETNSSTSALSVESNENSEEVLTRHLLKLSEIETQFQELTNKFEEINFKLDKLSSRLSKIQADNQLRFQQLEQGTVLSNNQNTNQLLSEDTKDISQGNEEKILPGSSQPQDLGSISYKDMGLSLIHI